MYSKIFHEPTSGGKGIRRGASTQREGLSRKGEGGRAHVMRGRRGRVVLLIMHGLGRMTIDPRIPTIPGRSTSGFHRSGKLR